MEFQGNFKIAAIAALGVMLLAVIAGAVVFGLTLVRDTTEDTAAEIVGETAGAAVVPVAAMGEAAPDSPLMPETAEAAGSGGAPSSVSATLSSCSTTNSVLSCGVDATWQAPDSEPLNYEARIQFSDGTGDAIESGSLSNDTLSYAFTLSAYGEYTAGVRAAYSDGESDWETANVLVAEVPDTLSSVTVGRGTERGTAHLEWSIPDANGSAIARYEAQCKVNTSAATWEGCNGSPFAADGSSNKDIVVTIYELSEDHAYTIRARAVNKIGAAAWKESSLLEPK